MVRNHHTISGRDSALGRFDQGVILADAANQVRGVGQDASTRDASSGVIGEQKSSKTSTLCGHDHCNRGVCPLTHEADES